MKNGLKGIVLILFAIMLMLYSIIDPSVIIFDDVLTHIAMFLGVFVLSVNKGSCQYVEKTGLFDIIVSENFILQYRQI